MGASSIADDRYTRTVYVSTDISRIPRNAAAVAGRINGPYQVPASDWQLFPNSALITLDAMGISPEASDVLDIYSGDATLDQLISWWEKHTAARSLKPGVRIGAEDAARVHELLPPQHCALWVVAMGGLDTFPGATVVENRQMAAPTGALVTTGTMLDPQWMPTPPADPHQRRAFDSEHAHMTRLRRNLPLQNSGPSRGTGNKKG